MFCQNSFLRFYIYIEAIFSNLREELICLLAVGPATHRKPGQPGIHRPDGDVHEAVQGKVQDQEEEEQPSATRWMCLTLCPG